MIKMHEGVIPINQNRFLHTGRIENFRGKGTCGKGPRYKDEKVLYGEF